MTAGRSRSVRGESDVEADEECVPDAHEEARRRFHAELADLELALAPDPELVVPESGAGREAHRALHAADRHDAGDGEEDVRAVGHGGKRRVDLLDREPDLRIAVDGEEAVHVAI